MLQAFRFIDEGQNGKDIHMSAIIPFNRPSIVGDELKYIAQAVAMGNLAGDGFFTQECARLLEERFRIRKVLLTPSCTSALEIAAMLCGLNAGSEAIVPTYTFPSTANAVLRIDARPVFVDIRPDTLNLDEGLIEAAITPRTGAIFPVHYAGVACEMDRILDIARRHDLLVVEDAAQGVNAFYHGRALGTLGDLGAFSFHETKNYIAGQGGALCINSPELIDRAEIIRDKGTNRQQFFRGEVDKYTWMDVGSASVPSEINCAFLLAQLEQMEEISQKREAAFRYYRERLAPLVNDGLIAVPAIPEGCATNHHIFYILLSTSSVRDSLMAHLKGQGVQAVFHYIPLHLSAMGRRLGYKEKDLPVSEDLSGRLLRLPMYYSITEPEQERICGLIRGFLKESPSLASLCTTGLSHRGPHG